MLRFFPFEDGFEVLKDGLHDVGSGGVWSVNDEEVVVVRAKEDNQQFLIFDVVCPKEGGDRQCEGFRGLLAVVGNFADKLGGSKHWKVVSNVWGARPFKHTVAGTVAHKGRCRKV